MNYLDYIKLQSTISADSALNILKRLFDKTKKIIKKIDDKVKELEKKDKNNNTTWKERNYNSLTIGVPMGLELNETYKWK